MKSGFTLIEVLVFIVIASMMSVALYQGFDQTNRVVKYVDNMVSLDQRIFIVQDRLEKDLAGAFIPTHQPLQNEQDKIKPAGEQKKQITVLPKLFYSVNQEQTLKELTFVTTNPLQVYGVSQPRIARVQYQLLPDKDHKNAFKLTRQESLRLSYDKFQESNPREYVLADNIKNIIVEYGTIEKDTNKKENVVTSAAWNSDERAPQSKEEQKKKSLLPRFVRVTIVLWNNKGDRSVTYENTLPIYGLTHIEEKKKTQQQKGNQNTKIFGVKIPPKIHEMLSDFERFKQAKGGG
jgi:prepilin-type N-terminal cleavage/methylation domain-containing protein